MATMKNTLPKTVLAAVVPFGLGLVVHRQGFNLLDDGLWLLGAKTIAQGDLLYRDLFSIYGPVRYLLLLPFFSLAGQSALALVLFKAVTDGVEYTPWRNSTCGLGLFRIFLPIVLRE